MKKYEHFLEKVQAISGQDIGTHVSILNIYKISQYSYNISTIDNTDIPCCVAAMGRELKFPLDIYIGADPTIDDDR